MHDSDRGEESFAGVQLRSTAPSRQAPDDTLGLELSVRLRWRAILVSVHFSARMHQDFLEPFLSAYVLRACNSVKAPCVHGSAAQSCCAENWHDDHRSLLCTRTLYAAGCPWMLVREDKPDDMQQHHRRKSERTRLQYASTHDLCKAREGKKGNRLRGQEDDDRVSESAAPRMEGDTSSAEVGRVIQAERKSEWYQQEE